MDVGSDVESKCTKCRGATTHVVIAMVGTEISKVECSACGGLHKYRDPKKKTPVRKKAAAKKEPVGPSVEPDMDLPVRAYQISDTYQLGQRIEHSVFGAGVIEVVMPAKVRVFFPEGQKVLMHSRAN